MRIILTGASGRMGKQMLALFQSIKNVEIFAVDKAYEYDQKNDTPSCVSAKYARIADVKECADVIVDFSLHTAVPEVVDFAVRNCTPLVVATTGHTEQERACVAMASESIPVFAASNMSIAIAYLKDFSAKLAAVFESADIEILEAHHSKKLDSPSGTALSIAKRIVKQRGFGKIVIGRGNAREKGEINVHSLRLGESLGEHEVIIDTGSERIILRHEAFSRGVYAEGALKAARFILSQPNGLYGIEDLLNFH